MHNNINTGIRYLLSASALVVVLTGCGGGGTTASLPSVAASPAAVAASPAAVSASPAAVSASPTPTLLPTQTVLATTVLLGANSFVNLAGRTTYVLSADTFNTSACAAAPGCTGVWPPVAPPSGVTLFGGFSSFVRSDGQTQLSFNGNPLYTYAGDSGPGQTNGNGINSFGGIWTVAHPTLSVAGMSAADPQPTSTPIGGSGF